MKIAKKYFLALAAILIVSVIVTAAAIVSLLKHFHPSQSLREQHRLLPPIAQTHLLHLYQPDNFQELLPSLVAVLLAQ